MLVIHPDECIDCGVCEPECPVEAIKPDTEPGLENLLKLNADFAKIWPNITAKKEPPADAKEWEDVPNKLETQFLAQPGNRRLVRPLTSRDENVMLKCPKSGPLRRRKALILAKNVLYTQEMSKAPAPEPLPQGSVIFRVASEEPSTRDVRSTQKSRGRKNAPSF